MPFPDSTDTDSRRALALVFDACDADPGCRSAFPEIRAALTELVSRLEREPIATSIDHPRTGARQHVEVDADTFGAYVRVLLYSPADSALLPSVIMRTAAGDLRPLAALAARAASWSTETMALGTTLSVLCTEDVAPEQPAHLVAPRHLSFLARAYVGTWYRACREWPRGRRPAIEPGAPLPVPALVLSGGLDPATPPRWGEAMAKHFHPSLHAVAPEAGHNVSFTGCAPELIARFIDAGTTDSVDASCLAAIRRPPFALSFAGSRP
jgi:pimeloyl-ACP methyl ester carboxylesterase